MADETEPVKEFEEWWPTGRDWWITEKESLDNFVRRAFYAGWQQRDAQLARVARTPDSLTAPGSRLRVAGPHRPLPEFKSDYTATSEVYDWKAPRWTPGKFEGAQDPSMRLQPAAEVPEVRPSDDTNPGFEHTSTVWEPPVPAWMPARAIDDTFDRIEAAWGASGPVPTPLSLQEDQ